MSAPETDHPPRSISRRQAGLVAGASMLGALSNFLLMFIGVRTLSDPADQTEFLAFWSLLTGMFGVLSGVQNESTRAVGAVASGRHAGTRMIGPSLLWGAIVAACIAACSPVLLGRIVPNSGVGAVVVLVVVTLFYAGHVCLVGSFGGRGLWTHYAGLLAGEVVLRMVLVGVVAALGATLLGLEVALAAATSIVLVFLVLFPSARTSIASRSDAAWGRQVRQLGLAVLSTSCTALLVTAYPAIARALNPHADARLVGATVLAVSLTRAPILMPLTSFQGVAIKAFQKHRAHPLAALQRPAGVLFALAAVGAAPAWFVGPWALTIFEPDYAGVVPGWVFAALLGASALVAVLTLLGTLVLALDDHLGYAVGWLVASVGTIAVLALPQPLVDKVVASLWIGPLAGSVVLAVSLVRSARRTKDLG